VVWLVPGIQHGISDNRIFLIPAVLPGLNRMKVVLFDSLLIGYLLTNYTVIITFASVCGVDAARCREKTTKSV
jgi:hypothetical protein